MNNIKISLDVVNPGSSNDLGLEIWIDDTNFFDSKISPGKAKVIFAINEDESNHQFKMIFKNKTSDHTKIDNSGNILSDEHLLVENIRFDDINVDHMFIELSKYRHDTNGTQDLTDHPFCGYLGCNGIVTLDFSTPFYIWLLENM